MLDVFNLPSSTGATDIQIFTTPTVTLSNVQWHTWVKPRGKTMAFITCIGGGGGGGGGFTAAAAAARGGGGGGGSSAVTKLTVPLFQLPDTLYIQVGAGGIGQVSGGGVAGSGVQSYVAVHPDTTSVNVLLYSGGIPTGGGTGTGAAVGALGSAGSIATVGNMPLSGIGVFSSIAGQNGTAGGAVAGAVGGAQSIPTTSVITSGGTGGAGTTSADFAGGLWTAVANSIISDWRPATPAAGSNNGSGGTTLWKPTFFFGGSGGSSSNAGIGGWGGNGSYGSGGGGGGGGTTGGRGGDGGSGIVIIYSW